MVRDLDLTCRSWSAPSCEPDGLALSSRNAYLNPEQRKQGLVLSRSLQKVRAAAEAGESDARRLNEIGTSFISSEPEAKLDYFAIVNPDTLEPVDQVVPGTLVAVAAWIGTTRLIDNMLL